jgi:hypothetical protein
MNAHIEESNSRLSVLADWDTRRQLVGLTFGVLILAVGTFFVLLYMQARHRACRSGQGRTRGT